MATQRTLTERLNCRISIQQKSVVTDDEGISVETWNDVVAIWAAYKPLNGREFFAAAAVNAENTARYEIRRRKDILSDMRLIDGDRTFSITAVIDDPFGDRACMHIKATEVPRNG